MTISVLQIIGITLGFIGSAAIHVLSLKKIFKLKKSLRLAKESILSASSTNDKIAEIRKGVEDAKKTTDVDTILDRLKDN